MTSTKIDFTSALIDAELRIGVLEKTLELLLARSQMGSGQRVISSEDIRRIQATVVEILKDKYPGAGIELSQTRLRVKPPGTGVGSTSEQVRATAQLWILYEYR